MAVIEKNIVISTEGRNAIEFDVSNDYDILKANSITLKVFQNGSSSDYTAYIVDHGARKVVMYFSYPTSNAGISYYELWLEEHDTSKAELLYKGVVEWL